MSAKSFQNRFPLRKMNRKSTLRKELYGKRERNLQRRRQTRRGA